MLQGVRYFFNPRTYKGVEWSGVGWMSNFDNFFFYIKEYWPIELTALRIENAQRRSLTLPLGGYPRQDVTDGQLLAE